MRPDRADADAELGRDSSAAFRGEHHHKLDRRGQGHPGAALPRLVQLSGLELALESPDAVIRGSGREAGPAVRSTLRCHNQMNMLAVTGGRQRTVEELDAIFAASGWRRVGLSPTHTINSLLELEARS
jgi:hypothetical protein